MFLAANIATRLLFLKKIIVNQGN